MECRQVDFSGTKLFSIDGNLMETPCTHCSGKGVVPKEFIDRNGDPFMSHEDCPRCGRVGMMLTQGGRLLLDFVTRHVGPHRYWQRHLEIKNADADVRQVEITDEDVRTETPQQGR